MPLSLGSSARAELEVGEGDTAQAIGSGDVPVLATPRVLALCERACVEAVAAELEPGETTVGRRVKVDHVAPVPVGRLVTAEATLDRVEGRKLVFNVTVSDERGLVAAGKVLRVVVKRDRFLSGIR